MLILCDTREKQPYKLKGYDHTAIKLDTGDYTIEGCEHLFSVDRKASVSELATNLTQKRFARELERLAQIDHPYLLLEFSPEDISRYPIGSDVPRKRWRYIKVRAPFIFAALTKINVEYGINIIYGYDRAHSERLLIELCKRIDKKYGQVQQKV